MQEPLKYKNLLVLFFSEEKLVCSFIHKFTIPGSNPALQYISLVWFQIYEEQYESRTSS